ncbi:Hypothetical protein AA314_07178 [Archangium gephyra]|uniref:Uncharacterized protein n=1 Tax=Archangium gephyra TaxID=48 RepID=A0AAC8TGV3_9BACT|nr:Hypothetical protein AA314_07178 [Archangium gephyra]
MYYQDVSNRDTHGPLLSRQATQPYPAQFARSSGCGPRARAAPPPAARATRKPFPTSSIQDTR